MVPIGIKYLQVNSHMNCGAQSLHSENTHKQICRSYAMKCGLNVMNLGSRSRLLMFKLPFSLLKDDFRECYLLLGLNFSISKWGKHKPSHKTVMRIKYVNTWKMLYIHCPSQFESSTNVSIVYQNYLK